MATKVDLPPVDPIVPCPKCGDNLFSGWLGPDYMASINWANSEELQALEQPEPGLIRLKDALALCAVIHERLAFRCKTCGYERSEPTKDAVK